MNNRKTSQPHLIIDLDGLLTTKFNKFDHLPDVYPAYQWFKNNNAIINVPSINPKHLPIPHILHPGGNAFIKYMMTILPAKISFLSTCNSNKSYLLVEALLKHVLGEAEYHCGYVPKTYYLDYLKPQYYSFFLEQKEAIKNNYYAKLIENEFTIIISHDGNLTCKAIENNLLLGLKPTQWHFEHFYEKVCDVPSREDIIHVNHIFYLTGVLDECLHNNLQLSNLPNDAYYQNKFYIKGLNILQKIDPQLNFYGGEAAEKYFCSTLQNNYKRA